MNSPTLYGQHTVAIGATGKHGNAGTETGTGTGTGTGRDAQNGSQYF